MVPGLSICFVWRKIPGQIEQQSPREDHEKKLFMKTALPARFQKS